MAPRVVSQMIGVCRCKRKAPARVIATDVKDTTEVLVLLCVDCDGPGPWGPQRVFDNLTDEDDLG